MRKTIRSGLALPLAASSLAFAIGLGAGWAVAEEPAETPAAEQAADERASAEWVVEVDPLRSSVTFELGATLHTVDGTAELTGGSLRFDPAAGTASGRIEVDATSLDTGKENRDEDMHQKVLESARYPEIYFEAEGVSGSFDPEGESRVTLDGRFGIHGDEHPVSLEVDVEAGGQALEASTELRVPYVEWGMEDPSTFLLRVDKHVTVRIDVAGTLSKPEPQGGGDEAADEGDGAAANG